jgi:hypothetical protein
VAPSDCPKGETCAAGGCTRPCASDGDCHFGERCDALDGTCVTQSCSAAQGCGAGRRCEATTVAAELSEPELVEIGGAPFAFVALKSQGASAILRARVDAPGRWVADPEAPVIADGAAPSALVDGDRVDLWYASADGSAIRHALSTDRGATFEPSADPVLEPGAAWEGGWVGSPSVVRFEGATWLFYEGGPRAGVGAARIESGHATRVSEGPIASPESVTDPPFWRAVREVGAPYAVVAGSALRVYFTGRGIEGADARVGGVVAPADENDSIGLTASLDGETWRLHPAGPVLARVTNLRTYLGEREAAVRLFAGGGAEITFVAADASGASPNGLARAVTR